MPFKHYLMTPGPTPIPQRVALAMAQPIPHHRSPTFERILADCREGLKWIFGTTQEVLIQSSSGTGALEAALVNLCRRDDEIIYVNAGKFGERWGRIASAFGLKAHEIRVPWGEAVDPAVVNRLLNRLPKAAALCVQASESSTGVAHPIRELAELTRQTSTSLIVDAVSALGAMPLPMDEWGIDVLLTASQKALMLPPGLAFSAASRKAWQRIEQADLPRFTFDWRAERAAQSQSQALWTPAISLILGLAEVLRWLRGETLGRIYERHERMGRATRAAVEALGLTLFAKRPAASITTVNSPVDSEAARQAAAGELWCQLGWRAGCHAGQDSQNRPPGLLRRLRRRRRNCCRRTRAGRARLPEVPIRDRRRRCAHGLLGSLASGGD